MAENENEKAVRVVDGIEQQSRPSDPDWNPDNFPTSAKPIFRAAGLLVASVIALCFATYSCSDHTPEQTQSAPKPKLTENPLDDSE